MLYVKIIYLKPLKARRLHDGAAALLRQRGRGDHVRPQAGLGDVGGEAEARQRLHPALGRPLQPRRLPRGHEAQGRGPQAQPQGQTRCQHVQLAVKLDVITMLTNAKIYNKWKAFPDM